MRNTSILAFIVLAGVMGACDALSSEPGDVLSITQLKYRLLDRYELFYCDPDFWPVVRGDEQERALERFPDIAADTERFGAILEHLGFANRTDFSAQEKLLIYREDKRLVFVILEADGSDYRYQLRASEQQQVFAISGEIDSFGDIAERQKVLTVGTCPICLSGETLIATSTGPVRVRDLADGTMIWSQDETGHRVLVPLLAKSSVPMPIGHEFIRLRLEDGRELLASPGHPTADDRRLSDLAVGDSLDGSRVLSATRVPAQGDATYDILSASPTAVYWANGVLLGSTLSCRGPCGVDLRRLRPVPVERIGLASAGGGAGAGRSRRPPGFEPK